MSADEKEDDLLRSVALQNASTILLARHRAEEELVAAKEALERKTAELAESLAQIRATLESTTDGILVTDDAGKVTGFNLNYVAMWRMPTATMDSRDHRQLLAVAARQLDDPAPFLDRVEAIYASAPPESFDVLELADGRVLERFSKIQQVNGRNTGRVWSFRDITLRKRAENELRQQREWFQVTLSSIGDAVIATDTAGKITFLNPIAEHMTGWRSTEALGRGLIDVFRIVNETTLQPAENPVVRALREGVIVGLANHTALIGKDGTHIPIEDSAAPIRDAAGKITGAVIVFHDVTARKRAEEALRASEEQLRATFNQAAVGMAIAGLDGRFEQVNRRFEEILGYSANELQHHTFRGLTYPEDLPQTNVNVQRLLGGEVTDYVHEKRYLRKDGRVVWSFTSVTLLRDAAGLPQRFIGVIEDITQRKEAEETAREGARRLELALAAGQLGDWTWDAQTDLVVLGVRAADIFGLAHRSTITWSEMRELLHEEDRESARQAVEQALATRSAYNTEYRVPDPARGYRWVAASGHGIYAKDGTATGMTGVVQDITERKHADELRSHLAAVVESSDDAIVTKTLDGIITTWNKGAERMFGYAAEEAIGKPVTILIPADRADEEPAILERLKRGERIDHYETVRQRKDGTLFNVSLSVSPMADARGRIVGASKIARDITDVVKARTTMAERRQELETLIAERTASLREAVAQMEEFSYSVSHDLRSPLRAMQGYAQVVLEDYGDRLDAEGREYLQRIVKAGSRMDRLTQDVLNYSKIGRGSMRLELVSLDKLVTETIQQYVPTDSFRGAIVVEYPLLNAMGHEPLLVQAVSNLLANAVKFVRKGEQPSVRVRTEARGRYVRLWVEDNGIGIAPEYQDRIWGMFERVHPKENYEGTGIGLAIVRKAVERMGGQVGVDSDGAKGSRFWIQLPASSAAGKAS
ncbi:MAG: PAS domain S-box protein [Opitutaceae bacterium]